MMTNMKPFMMPQYSSMLSWTQDSKSIFMLFIKISASMPIKAYLQEIVNYFFQGGLQCTIHRI